MTSAEIKKAIAEKNLRALGRLISAAENREISLYPILKDLYADLGFSRVIGFTGPPGAGKSTLINDYVRHLRSHKEDVAVVAVDPVSPFTGGALLGDRIRLADHFNDPGVFIRSLSTRGKLGGLSVATRQVIHLLDGFRFQNTLIETVGVGQSEVDVRHTAEITVVVLVPEWGDSIQALKSGLLEIGDVFVVNKSDREGAERVHNEIKSMLEMVGREKTPLLMTTSTEPKSTEKLWSTIRQRYEGDLSWRIKKRLDNAKAELLDLVQDYVAHEGKDWLGQTLPKQGNPYSLFMEFLKRHPAGSLFS